jgi:hypothetical protein
MSLDILHGKQITDRLVHIEAKNELMTKRVEKANKINASIRPVIKGARKDFKGEMANIVRNKR